MNRRDVLVAISVGTVAGLAGCDGQGGQTPTAADDASDPTTTAASTPADAGGTTADGGGGSTETAGSGSTSLSDVEVQSVDSYRFRIDMSSYEGNDADVVMEGRFSGGDFQSSTTTSGQSYDSYFVDGTYYYVTGGQCVELGDTNQQTNVDTGQWAGTEDTTTNLREWGDVTATGTRTIDGEAMYVFEVDPEGRAIEHTYTYYISVDSGYLRRMEAQGLVADYWDWGAAPAVEAPC